MLAYIRLHRLLPRFTLGALTLSIAVLAGCRTTSPSVRVLGVEQARRVAVASSLVVFVEVVNPTQRELTLSRLEYRVRAKSWFESEGAVHLVRQIGAGSSAIVEIPVPVERPSQLEDGSIPYTLEGKLFAREDSFERSWRVAVRGALGARLGEGGAPMRVTVVDEAE